LRQWKTTYRYFYRVVTTRWSLKVQVITFIYVCRRQICWYRIYIILSATAAHITNNIGFWMVMFHQLSADNERLIVPHILSGFTTYYVCYPKSVLLHWPVCMEQSLHSWRTRGLPWTLARCSLKCFPFPTLSQSAPQLRMFLLEFRDEVNREETSHWAGLLRGESCMMLTSIVFDSSTRAADRRMDGRYSICCRALKIIIIRLCREAFEVWRHLH